MRSTILVLGASLLVTLTAVAGDAPVSGVAAPPAIAPVGSACAPAVRWLLERQRPDGSFGTTKARLQTTAFVAIALADDHVVARTPDVRRALRRATEFIVDKQADSGAFLEGEVDHTLLALLALVALRDGSAAEPPPAELARAALPLLPLEARAALDDPAAAVGDASLLRAAWALTARE